MKKENRGITLIALVITIIVLLILAGVTIVTLTGDNGLITKASEAKEKLTDAEIEEEMKLAHLEYNILKNRGEVDITFTDYILQTKYNGIQVGDKVEYDELSNNTRNYTTDANKGIGGNIETSDSVTDKFALVERTYTTENLTWRVLGINEKGQIELISEKSTNSSIYLANEEGYLYGVDELNKMSDELYGKGRGAEKARSLNVEDINKLAGITTEEDKKALDSNYGTKWQYRYPTAEEVSGIRYMQYRKNSVSGYGSWLNITHENSQKFKVPGEKLFGKIDDETIIEGKSSELTYSTYSYTISQKVTQTTQDGNEMANILSMNNTGNQQWLASKCDYCDRRLSYGVFYIGYGLVNWNQLSYSDGSNYYRDRRLRPVVILNYDIQFSGNSIDGWRIN